MGHIDDTTESVSVAPAANILAVLAGALLLCSPLTLLEAPGGFFSVTTEPGDGTQLADRGLRILGVIWPVSAMVCAVVGGLRRSIVTVALGFGVLLLTASFGTSLLAGYVEQFGVGDPQDSGVVRSNVFVVGLLSVAVVASAIWLTIGFVRDTDRRRERTWSHWIGVAGLTLALGATVVASVQLVRDLDLPVWPSLAASVFILIAAAAMASGTRAGLVLAAAVAAARLIGTFDSVVLVGAPLSTVAPTNADKLALAGFAVALVCAVAALVPPLDSVRSGAGSLRSRMALADEWDD